MCNLPADGSESGLLLVDTVSQTCSPVELPGDGPISATGLACSDDHIYLAADYTWGAVIVALERATLAVKAVSHLRGTLDPHSIAIHGDRLFVASTGTNSIVGHTLDGPAVLQPRLAWSANTSYQDLVHLNGVAVSANGGLFCTGFGPLPEGGWAAAENGFVMDVNAGSLLETGVRHPHTPMFWNDELVYLGSWNSELRSVNRQRAKLEGYTRGMAIMNDATAWIGCNRARHGGKAGAPDAIVTSIWRMDIATGTLLAQIVIPTNAEIFDVLAL